MKRLTLIIFSALVFLAGQSQNATQDSIHVNFERLNKATADSSRAKLLYTLSYYYQFYNLDSALRLARSAYELSDRINFEKGRARSLGLMAGAYNKLGNYNKA